MKIEKSFPCVGGLILLAPMMAPLSGQTVVGTITRPGLSPTAVAVYETGNKVFVADSATGNLYCYDGATNAELGSAFVGAGVRSMVVNEASGKLYAAPNNAPPKIAVVNAATCAFIKYLAGSYSNYPQLAQDPSAGASGHLYVLSLQGLRRIIVATDVESSVICCGGGGFESLGVNPATDEVFVTRWIQNDLVIVDGINWVIKTIVPGLGALGIGVNPTENKVNTAYPLRVYDRDTGTIQPIACGNDATVLAYHSASNRMYTDSEVNAVSTIIEGASDACFNLPMLSPCTELGVRNATGHVYYVCQERIGVLEDSRQLLELIAVNNPTPSSIVRQAIAVNQDTGRVYVINDSNLDFVTVIQDTAMMLRPPVYLGSAGFPSRLHVLDPVDEIVVDTWTPPDAFQKIHTLAVRPGGGRVYVPRMSAFGSGLQVYAGAGTHALLTATATGGSGSVGAAVLPDSSRVYVTNSAAGSNNVGVIDAATNTFLTTVAVGSTPWGIAATPDGSRVYVANRDGNTVSVIDTATNTVVGSPIAVCASPWGVAVNPSGTRVYVACSGAASVAVIDVASAAVIATVPVGSTPHWLTVTPDGKRVFVANRGAATVSVIDTGNNTVIQTVPVVMNPEGIGALPDGSEVFVVNSNLAAPSSLSAINTATYAVTPVPLPPNSVETIGLAITDPTSKFAGRVSSSGTPVAGALVRALQGGVERGTATANAAGDYSVFNLKPGTYDIEASAAGCTTQTAPGRSAGAGRTTLVNFALTCGITPPTVTVVAPNGGEKLYTASSYRIEWTASSPVGLSFFDVFYSIDGGVNFTPVAGCSGVSGAARSCVWASPGPATSLGRIKVIAHDSAGNSASDTSNANYSVLAGAGSITVTAPNTAVNWGIGSTQPIKWSHNLGTNSYVKIELSRDGGSSWSTISAAFKNTGATASTYNWVVTGPATTQARVRVSWTSGPASDASDVNFAITAPFITVSAPNTATVKWGIGTQQSVLWTTNLGLTDNVRLLLSTDGGSTFPVTLAASTPNDKSQVVTVSNNPTTMARVRVEWIANPAVGDMSNANFPIAAPFITVTKPNGGEQWASGSTQTVTWSSNLGSKEYVKIELSTDGGVTFAPIGTAPAAAEVPEESVLLASTPSDGSQAVVVPAVSSSTCRVRITWLDNPAVNDMSNANFTIGPAFLTVTVPNGNENWPIGLARTITWSSNIGGNVKLELSTNGGASWSTLVASTLNDGSHALIVPNTPTTQARVRVSSLAAGFTAYTDTSDANFTIAAPFVTVVAPNGGETWTIGSARTIQWMSNTGGNVKIELSRDGGSTWSTLVAATLNDGSHPWTVTGPASPNCRIRVTSTTVPAATDTSNGPFAIQ